jgi:hypothetical protein
MNILSEACQSVHPAFSQTIPLCAEPDGLFFLPFAIAAEIIRSHF